MKHPQKTTNVIFDGKVLADKRTLLQIKNNIQTSSIASDHHILQATKPTL